MKSILLSISAFLFSGCTILGTATGAVTGIVDCTVLHVSVSGPAGLVLLPITPLEGAYKGAKLGWYADQAVLRGEESLRPMAHVLPCTSTAVLEMWGGM